MDESSVDDKETIRVYYVEKIKDMLCDFQEIGEIDSYLSSLNKFDSKRLKEEKKKAKKNKLILKLISLKDDLNCKKGLNNLNYTIEYSNKLMLENINNYRNLVKYSKIYKDKNNIINEDSYLNYARYCDDFSNMSARLVEEIKNRPSNGFLILSLIKFEEEENYLKNTNEELRNEIQCTLNKFNNKIKRKDN